jgi:hypothetical protein
MQVIAGGGERGPIVSSAVVASALVLLAFTVLSGFAVYPVAALLAAVATGVVAYRTLFQWRMLIAAMLVVILFIPIRRYTLPGNLPFNLEPYRLAVALIVAAWITSLVIDPRVRLRNSPFDWPIGVVVAAWLGSELANPGRVSSLGSYVVKSSTFLASFLFLFYLIVSVVRSRRDIDLLVRLLVRGGVLIAALAVVERRTGFNPFNHLSGFIPGLQFRGAFGTDSLLRAGRLRVYGPAEHPIALGAALVMLIPMAVYLAHSSGKRRWWGAVVVLLIGAMSTSSRTAIVMFIVVILVYLRLRPVETKRLWPALLPALVVIHLALPGALGTVKGAFLPSGGLIKDQSNVVAGDTRGSDGRLAKLGPSLGEAAKSPLLGLGYGTRVVGYDVTFHNAIILDDQWLGTLLDVGVIGFAGWLWLFVRAVRRLGREAKQDTSPRGWLLTALAASIAAFGVGMVTFDAFSFIQVTFFFWVMLALGATLLSPGTRYAS